jgi:hypothetical protein
VLFHEALGKFNDHYNALEKSFARFERAAAKGHEGSIWIGSVVKNVEKKKSALTEAFAQTGEPLGYYFVAKFSEWCSREEFDFYKESAEGGCSWGQVEYGLKFRNGGLFVGKDRRAFVEWLEKAANQNNPLAMQELGERFRYEGDKEKAVSYFRTAAALGWKMSIFRLAEMLRDGSGCVKDSRQAVIWGAKVDYYVSWDPLEDARQSLGSGMTEDLDCDFNQLCYALGWGVYWYQYETGRWKNQSDEKKAFGSRCLDFYCSCVELQQKSIITFLLFWNRTTGGIKGPGQMIAQMVWEGREDNLVKAFEQPPRRSARLKRIKK